MKPYKISAFIILCLHLYTNQLLAQTVNTGLLHVESDTEFSLLDDFGNTTDAMFVNNGTTYFHADLTNDGDFDFTDPATATMHLVGAAQQTINGNGTSFLNNLIVDNHSVASEAINLMKTISITGAMFFEQGIVSVQEDSGLLLFQQDATHAGASDTSHVNGYVNKLGHTAFEYPIGNSGYHRHASKGSGIANEEDDFSVRYTFQNPNDLYPIAEKATTIDRINDQEYWTVRNNSEENTQIELTLSWDTLKTTPATLINEAVLELSIVRFDPVLNQWVDEGGTVNFENHTVTATVAVNHLENVFTLATVLSNTNNADLVNVYNGISANADGVNDYLIIENVQSLPNNRVAVYNRLGVKVFETDNYDTTGNIFTGISEGRGTISADDKLPNGTYFYVLSYDTASNTDGTGRIRQTGYLYLLTE